MTTGCGSGRLLLRYAVDTAAGDHDVIDIHRFQLTVNIEIASAEAKIGVQVPCIVDETGLDFDGKSVGFKVVIICLRANAVCPSVQQQPIPMIGAFFELYDSVIDALVQFLLLDRVDVAKRDAAIDRKRPELRIARLECDEQIAFIALEWRQTVL